MKKRGEAPASNRPDGIAFVLYVSHWMMAISWGVGSRRWLKGLDDSRNAQWGKTVIQRD